MKRNQSRLFGARQSLSSPHKLTSSGGTFRFWLAPVIVCVLLIVAAISNSKAQITSAEDSELQQRQVLVPLGTEYQNNIKLLNNRFRIDANIEEITMIFFRVKGSAPIVLVQPDGAKLSLALGQDSEDLKWFETDTYDMITVKNPTPGPWQAVGQILPESKVMVVTDIGLEAQPIPSPVFSGEVLKQTATLLNDGRQIDFSDFKDVVTLNIDFVSNNNPNFENFGLGAHRVASFSDDGKVFDEYALDGIFTGRFDLDITPGEWRPTFSVITPMYTRELVNDLVILLPNPVSISVELDQTGEGDHLVSIDVDREQLDMKSFIFDGVVKYPNGESENVSYTYAKDEIKTVRIINNDYGIYRFKITAYAKTVGGRDIVLSVPEFSFQIEAPPPPPPEPSEEELAAVQEENVEQEVVEETEMSTMDLLILVIAINAFIIIMGALILYIVMDIKRNPNSHLLLKIKSAISTLPARFKKTKSKDEQQKDINEQKAAKAN